MIMQNLWNRDVKKQWMSSHQDLHLMKETLLKRRVTIALKTNEKNSPVVAEENKSFGEILSWYDNCTINLGYVKNWAFTNKPYPICSKDGKVDKTNTKSLFRNLLQSLSRVAPIKSTPTCTTTSIVNATRVVRIITIKDANLPCFFSFKENICVHWTSSWKCPSYCLWYLQLRRWYIS